MRRHPIRAQALSGYLLLVAILVVLVAPMLFHLTCARTMGVLTIHDLLGGMFGAEPSRER